MPVQLWSDSMYFIPKEQGEREKRQKKPLGLDNSFSTVQLLIGDSLGLTV